MLVTRKSALSGKVNTLDLPVTEEQMNRYETSLELIQNVFPRLSADQREFIKTGITQEEWISVFGTEEE